MNKYLLYSFLCLWLGLTSFTQSAPLQTTNNYAFSLLAPPLEQSLQPIEPKIKKTKKAKLRKARPSKISAKTAFWLRTLIMAGLFLLAWIFVGLWLCSLFLFGTWEISMSILLMLSVLISYTLFWSLLQYINYNKLNKYLYAIFFLGLLFLAAVPTFLCLAICGAMSVYFIFGGLALLLGLLLVGWFIRTVIIYAKNSDATDLAKQERVPKPKKEKPSNVDWWRTEPEKPVVDSEVDTDKDKDTNSGSKSKPKK
jgi:hypothetical protein